MATQSWIMVEEEGVIAGIAAVKRIQAAAELEHAQGKNPANSDCWGTLAVNLETLATRCHLAIDSINLLRG